MRNTLIVLGGCFVVAGFVVGFLFGDPHRSRAAGPTFITQLEASIDVPTTWTKANSPYHIGKDILIQVNSTLTIEPGVVVTFDPLHSQQKYSGMVVSGPGQLIAQGSASEPIVFTSVLDADYNPTATGVPAPIPGDWRGILFLGDNSVVEHVLIRYASEAKHNTGGLEFALASEAQVSNTTIEHSGIQAILVRNNAEPILDTLTLQNNPKLALVTRDAAGPGILKNSLLQDNNGQALIIQDINSRFRFENNTEQNNTASHIALSGNTIMRDVTWQSTGLPFVTSSRLEIQTGSTLTVEPGVVFKADTPFPQQVRILVNGNLDARGTEESPIVFTSFEDDEHGGDTNRDGDATSPQAGGWGGIVFRNSADSSLEHVHVLHSGSFQDNITGENHSTSLLLDNSIVAMDAITLDHGLSFGIEQENGGTFTLTNSNISNHNVAVVMRDTPDPLPTIKDNRFFDNRPTAMVYGGTGTIDATNNWWGDDSGPTHTSNSTGTGNIVGDNILFDPWTGKDPKIDPVVFLPGITGSWQHPSTGEWLLDPILHTYSNLMAAFENAGYVYDETLFPMPYQWRQDNRITAVELRQKISDVKQICGCNEVDIVAHSMGGLVARSYIQGDDYQDDVDQVIFLGTPHRGSPKSYLIWEGGEFGTTLDVFAQFQEISFSILSKILGYDSVYEYVRNEITTVNQLLPSFSYLKNSNTGTLNGYPENHPVNEFIDELSDVDSIHSLKGRVNIKNVVGRTPNDNTIEFIRVVSSPDLPKWNFGYPEGFGDLFGDHGLETGLGDNTVPEKSATSLGAADIYIDSGHSELPTDSQQDVLEFLTGERPAEIIDKAHPVLGIVNKVLLFAIFSPADIQVTGPHGNKVGKDFTSLSVINDIPGAYYTGFGSEVEFITIPNPIDGEYTFTIEGTGEGEYRVETHVIDEVGTVSREHAGYVLPGLQEEFGVTFDNASDAFELEPEDTTPPTTVITSPVAGQVYTHQDTITIEFETSDETGVLETHATLASDPVQVTNGEEVDLFELGAGSHELTVVAKDFLGNTSTSTATFIIGATETSLVEDIRTSYQKGWIHKKGVYKALLKHAIAIQRQNRVFVKQILLRVFAKQLEVYFQVGLISQEAFDLLSGDVEFLLDNL